MRMMERVIKAVKGSLRSVSRNKKEPLAALGYAGESPTIVVRASQSSSLKSFIRTPRA